MVHTPFRVLHSANIKLCGGKYCGSVPTLLPARTEPWFDPEEASFKFVQETLPDYDGHDGPRRRPKIFDCHMYAGVGLYESRGISLPSAIAAMLGDPYVYVESALFTLLKAQLLGLNPLNFIYESNRFSARGISSYNYFVHVISKYNATEILINNGFPIDKIVAAKQNESLASYFAKTICDIYFKMKKANISENKEGYPSFIDTFGLQWYGVPLDVVWTSSYLSFARQYGPNLVVLDPDPKRRGIILADWKRYHGIHGSCHDIIYGREIMHPQYIHGTLIRGFELRKFQRNKKNTGPIISLAFYKRSFQFENEIRSYVIVIQPPIKSEAECILDFPETTVIPTKNKSVPFTQCNYQHTRGIIEKNHTYKVTTMDGQGGPYRCNVPDCYDCTGHFKEMPLSQKELPALPVFAVIYKNKNHFEDCFKALKMLRTFSVFVPNKGNNSKHLLNQVNEYVASLKLSDNSKASILMPYDTCENSSFDDMRSSINNDRGAVTSKTSRLGWNTEETQCLTRIPENLVHTWKVQKKREQIMHGSDRELRELMDCYGQLGSQCKLTNWRKGISC